MRSSSMVLALVLLLVLPSCLNTRRVGLAWVKKSQVLYEADTAGKLTGGTLVYKERMLAKVEPGDTVVKVTPVSAKQSQKLRVQVAQVREDSTALVLTYSDDSRPALAKLKTYLVPKPEHDLASGGKCRQVTSYFGYCKGRKFKYYERYPMIQAMTIPMKVRFPLNDSIRLNAQGQFNIGVALGYKTVRNTYRNIYESTNHRILNDRQDKVTFATGIFIGPFLQDLKPENTGGEVQNARTAAGVTYGGFGLVGINQFNLGIAGGFDQPMGAGSPSWDYRGKFWLGLIVAFDLLK